MAAYKHPRLAEFRDSLLMTATGKIHRREPAGQAEPAGRARNQGSST